MHGERGEKVGIGDECKVRQDEQHDRQEKDVTIRWDYILLARNRSSLSMAIALVKRRPM